MAALIDADEFRERFDIDTAIGDPRIEPHISSASKRLREWVGDTNYDACLTLIATPDEDDDDGNLMLAILRNAEAHLTFHYSLLSMNYPLSSKGIVGTAMSDEAKEVRKYLSPKDTAEVAVQFLDAAEMIARPYRTADTSTPGIIVVSESDGSCEAVTRPCP